MTARGFYYSDKSTASVVQTAAINAFPKARHDGTTILVPIDMVKPGTPHTPADSVHSAGTVDGLDLLETQRVEYKGSQNHRDAAPEWLIGSELLMVQDPFDDTGSFTNTDGGTFAGYMSRTMLSVTPLMPLARSAAPSTRRNTIPAIPDLRAYGAHRRRPALTVLHPMRFAK